MNHQYQQIPIINISYLESKTYCICTLVFECRNCWAKNWRIYLIHILYKSAKKIWIYVKYVIWVINLVESALNTFFFLKKKTFILALFAVQKMDSKWSTLLHYFTNELVYQQSSSKYSKVHGQSEGCLIELILL